MATNDSTGINELRARVEALGHKLYLDHSADKQGPRWYVCNPTTGRVEHIDHANGVEEWCTDRETEAVDAPYAEAAAVRPPPAIADDFNGPYMGAKYERFLNLIVCAGSRDRFEAMKIRQGKGVEAAIEFLRTCNVTNEGEQRDEDDEPTTNNERHANALAILESVLTVIPLLSYNGNEMQKQCGFTLIENAIKRADGLLLGMVLRGEGGAA